jgi:protein O-mannosyl-transferase
LRSSAERVAPAQPPGNAGPRRARQAWAAIAGLLVVLAAVLTLHGPVLGAQGLCVDDSTFLSGDGAISHPSWASVARFFGEWQRPTTVGGYYLPLTSTSLMVDYAIGHVPPDGLSKPDARIDLFVFHRTNLVLHALTSGLVFLLLLRLFGSLPAATLTALLFACHPLTVESLAWIAERKSLLAALFGTLAALGHVERARGGPAGWRAMSLAAFALALLSKPTVTLLPVMLLLVDFWPLQRLDRRAVVEKWGYFALAFASAVVTMVSNAATSPASSRPEAGYLRWPLQAADLLGLYLGKVIWPVELSSLYPHRGPFTLENPGVIAGVIVTVSISAATVWLLRRTRGPFTGWACFLVGTFPVLGLVYFSPATSVDKYLYFPMIGLLLPLASGAAWLWNRGAGAPLTARRTLVVVLALSVLAAEAVGSRAALAHWRDSVTLWRHMALVTDEPLVHNLAGTVLGRAGFEDEAYRHFRRSVELNPRFEESQHNLGLMLAARGDLAGAADHFSSAIRLNPRRADSHVQLAEIDRRTGRTGDAEAEFRRALALAPGDPDARCGLAGLEMARGRIAEAQAHYQAALRSRPDDPTALLGLGTALLAIPGQASAALAPLQSAVRSAPGWPVALNALAWLRATSPEAALRDSAEALRLSERAVALSRGRDPNVLDTRAAALASAGRCVEAATVARQSAALARSTGADRLADDIERRAALYATGRPYRENPVR